MDAQDYGANGEQCRSSDERSAGKVRATGSDLTKLSFIVLNNGKKE